MIKEKRKEGRNKRREKKQEFVKRMVTKTRLHSPATLFQKIISIYKQKYRQETTTNKQVNTT